jgi:hypothetical protein
MHLFSGMWRTFMDAAPIVLSSTDSSDDGQDARAVLTSTTASKAEALKATARKRKRPDTSPLLKGLFAREYSSVEAIKDQLREWNPKCVPRVRSASGLEGRNVRFSCKNEKVAPHMCRLNVSALRVNQMLKMSCQTYRPGSCGFLECCICGDALEEGMYMRCDNGQKHTICSGCFNEMVRRRFDVLYGCA